MASLTCSTAKAAIKINGMIKNSPPIDPYPLWDVAISWANGVNIEPIIANRKYFTNLTPLLAACPLYGFTNILAI